MRIGQPENKKATRNRYRVIELEALESRLLLSTALTVPLDFDDPEMFPVAGGDGQELPVVPGRILAGLDPAVAASAEEIVAMLPGATLLHQYGYAGAILVGLPEGLSVVEGVEAVDQLPGVTYAEPDYIVTVDQVIPSDPDFDELWGLYNTGQTGGTADADTDTAEAWGRTTGSPDVVVGVIDTGIDYWHPDLRANIWTNPGEIPNNGIDDDGNGYVDDYYGWDFYNNDSDPFDDVGHGTHVAGTIGAVGNNGQGLAGVNWTVQLAALKFLGQWGGPTAGAVEAVEYAVMMGFDVTNNSWGGGGFSETLERAIEVAGENDQLFVASAGNSGVSNDVLPHYPSSYGLTNIISVAATDDNDDLASFSNYGSSSVDLAAPGVQIYSTVPNNSYDWYQGTSMAAPHVTGAVALLLAYNPIPTDPDDPISPAIKAAILDGVDPVASLDGLFVSGGRLNVLGAMDELALPIEAVALRAHDVVFTPDYLFGTADVDIQYTVRNAGNVGFSEDVAVSIYLSDNDTLEEGADWLLGSVTVSGGMSDFGTLTGSIDVPDFPQGDPFGTDHSYYVLLSAEVPAMALQDVRAEPVRWEQGLAFFDDFSTDNGWTLDTLGRWSRSPAEAGGGQYGNPDPAADATSTADDYILGYNVGGDYQNSMVNTIWATSPVIDSSGLTGVTLRFQRWLNVEDGQYDQARLEVFDGQDWQQVFVNEEEVTDPAWQLLVYDVSDYADGNDQFRIRFGTGPTDAWARYSGWNIDDVQVVGTLMPEAGAPQVANVVLISDAGPDAVRLEVQFTEGMARYPLVDTANYLLQDESQTPIPLGVLSVGVDTALLEVQASLMPGETYTLTITSGGLADNWANALDGDGDGAAGGGFEYSFSLPGLLAPQIVEIYGGQVTFYDTDAQSADQVDVRPAALVLGNDAIGITQVVLLPQYSRFGVVVEQKPGSSQPVAIYDRTFHPYGIDFIVAASNVSVLSVVAELRGMDLNGTALGGNVVLPLDLDGDGDHDDPAAFVGLGDVGVFVSTSPIGGDVVVSGDLALASLQGVDALQGGDVYVGGGLGQFHMAWGEVGDLTVVGGLDVLNLGLLADLTGDLVAGDIGVALLRGPSGVVGDVSSQGNVDLFYSLEAVSGDVSALGHGGRVYVFDDITGDMSFGNGLDLLYTAGRLSNVRVSVTGNVFSVFAFDSLENTQLDVSGSLASLVTLGDMVSSSVDVEQTLTNALVGWDYTDSDISARSLGRVTVGHRISSVGPYHEIHALTGRFGLLVGPAYYGIDSANDQWFSNDGVRAWVGEV